MLQRVFLGRFSFERCVSSPQVNFTGTAIFKQRHDHQILYHEQGQYQLEEHEQSFYQNRIYRIDKSTLYIYKNDLTLLHEFVLEEKPMFPFKLTHMHPCKNDQYFLEMVIHSLDHFSTSYTVRGPSKNYKIHTTFTRA